MGMFDFLESYQIVLVTGPQRSGTTICARMIEDDLGYKYLDEGLWSVWLGQRARELAEATWPCVLQAPGLLKDVALFNQPKCAVICMIRDIDKIRQSQDRIGWDMWAEKELSSYISGENYDWYEKHIAPRSYWTVKTLEDDYAAQENVAWIKYQWWYHHCDKLLTYRNWYDVSYEMLDNHPMWVNRSNRKDFSARQYRENNVRSI